MNRRLVISLAAISMLVATSTGYAASLPRYKGAISYVYRPAAAKIPKCAHAAKAIPFPRRFPTTFPVPAGTAITGKRVPIGGGIAATGFVPMRSFAVTVHFFPSQLPRHGFNVLHLEIDTPHDSEGSYKGHGYVGGWSLRAIPGCAAMDFQVSAVTSKS